MRSLLFGLLLTAGCGKKADPAPPAVPDEVRVALQETFAFLDSDPLDPADVSRRAKELATRWNTGWHCASGLLARPTRPRFAEALFVICYGANLNYDSQGSVESRVKTFDARNLTGYPETPESLRAAWKALGSCLSKIDSREAWDAVASILAQLWTRMKEKDPGVQAFLKRVGASVGAPIFLAILDRQPHGAALVVTPADPGHPSPRWDAATVAQAVEKAFYSILTPCFEVLKADCDLYGCTMTVRPVDAGPGIELRVRTAMKENGKTLHGLGNRVNLACLDVDLQLQFVQEGKPLGPELLLHRSTSDKLKWDLATETPDTILLRDSVFVGNAFIEQLTAPR